MADTERRQADSVYAAFERYGQPAAYRTFGEAIVAQHRQLIVLAVLFVSGLILAVTYSSFAGGTLMSGSGVALNGTVIGGRYH